MVLFLGSGALIGASLPGKSIPLGNDLRDMLNERFLGNEYPSESLQHVAALAASQNSLFAVQDFIADYFRDLKPGEFHLNVPKFKWRALFTTNYDRLVEVCYERTTDKLQDIVLMLSNADKIDETRITNDKLPLVKLHGCITRTHDESLPLILTVDQYNDSLDSRSRLFSHLYELAYENTVVFIGHSLQDSNIRSVLLRLHKEAPQGQRHYLLKPGIKQVEIDFWAEKRITSIDCSFEQFLTCIDSEITGPERLLSLVRPVTTHPIEQRFVNHAKPSPDLLRFLTDYGEYVSRETPFSLHRAQEFYRGVDQGWFPVAEGLSINRELSNRITRDAIQKSEIERKSKAELYVIKGEAGSGKTILLRQIAWESKESGIGIFLWIKSGTHFDLDVLSEVISSSSERLFLVWDDAARNSQEISRCITNAQKRNLPITIFTAERFSEWNTRCEELDGLVTGVFKLAYLSEFEIVNLIGKLDQHGCLGPNLTPKNEEERKSQFTERYGRQLLVALYEATTGERFEEIIFDEFSKITPVDAKNIYRTVCTLNRMRVPVRAGLISRIYGINFETFQKDFFKPLENIVISDSSGPADIHYKARHPEIAEIVFRKALIDPVDRYDEYIRILSKLNISYESDRSSFRTMIRARSLHELFPSFQDVKNIYDYTLSVIGEDAYLFQQIANFERIRPDGNLKRADELLERAREIAPYDSSIIHSLAVLCRDRATKTDDATAKIKFRRDSKGWLELIASKWGDNSYISCTLADLALDDLNDLIADNNSTTRTIDLAIRSAEKLLVEAKRKFPSDDHIYSIEARFAAILRDQPRIIEALEKSFSASRDPLIATRLSAVYEAVGEYEKAKLIIEQALGGRQTEYRLNYRYAELLRKVSEPDQGKIAYYYRRAYTPKDHNYQAQFWDARFAYESEEKAELLRSEEIFSDLRKTRLPFESKIRVRDYIRGPEGEKRFHGTLKRKKDGFGFITVDGRGQDIFFPNLEVRDGMWEALREGDRLSFTIGFSFNGPLCCEVDLL